ncbi:hypothetical protein JCGZ_27113 [Jatropha curcas]|uniref:Uncharacterized protein n=1 Tax=Jatropha curcas TaxID=180498 RepID=A0A067JM73_JATCU|nr:hypothetical protein JCGZ_27113 [Jatropha curcas]
MAAEKPWLLGIERCSHHLARFSIRSPFLALVARDRPSIRLERARQERSDTVNIDVDRPKEIVARLLERKQRERGVEVQRQREGGAKNSVALISGDKKTKRKRERRRSATGLSLDLERRKEEEEEERKI